MPLYEIKEPIKDYVGADTFDDAIVKYIKEHIKHRYEQIKITDHDIECIYAIRYNSSLTKFKFDLVQKRQILNVPQTILTNNLFDYSQLEAKRPISRSKAQTSNNKPSLLSPPSYSSPSPSYLPSYSQPSYLPPYSQPSYLPSYSQPSYLPSYSQPSYLPPSSSYLPSSYQNILYTYNSQVDSSKETPHFLSVNNKKYPSIILNKAIYPVNTVVINSSDVIINNHFNENKWENDIKKEFDAQYNFFENFFPSLKQWKNENVFADSNTPMSPNFNKYYKEALIKDISADLKSRTIKNNKMNVFSVSLFTGKVPSFVDRNIVSTKQMINYDQYINKHGNWTDQQANARNLGHVKPAEPWYKDILTYFEILFANIKLHQAKYPDWVVRLYTDDSIINSSNDKIKEIYQRLLNLDIQIMRTEFKEPYEGKIATMLTRFLPMFDKTVSKFLSIEADNWPTEVYWKVLDQWIKNNKQSLAYISGYTYGWPSGLKIDSTGLPHDFASLIHFRQNYGGMFGLSKPDNKIYNPKLLDYLMTFSAERREHFNKLFVDGKFILDNTQYDTNYHGVISTPISDKSLFDKGIDEVWLSLFVLPKLDSVFSIPVYGDLLNFSMLEREDKVEILNKYNMKEDIADLDTASFKSFALFTNKKNKTIFNVIEMILMEYMLGIRPNDTSIDFNKYKKTFVTTFINLYPDFQAAKNYNELDKIKTELDTDTLDLSDTYLLEKQKYLKYKKKYLTLKDIKNDSLRYSMNSDKSSDLSEQSNKKKYLSLRNKMNNNNKFFFLKNFANNINQKGGGDCDIVNRFVKIVHAVSDMTLDCNNPIISLKAPILNDRNQIFTLQNVRDDIYIIKQNNNCITSVDGNYRLEPIRMRPNQQFRIVKTDNDYYVINHIEGGVCIDANWDADIITKPYVPNDNNQKFYITPNFKNNDNNFSHIKPALQNLILSYTPNDIELDNYFGLMFEDGEILNISQHSTRLHPNYGQIGLTYSAILCPLIYNSLKKAGINVTTSWTNLYFQVADGSYQPASQETNHQFQLYCDIIANKPGWVNYALYILTEYEFRDNLDAEFYEDIFAESKRIIGFLKENGRL